MIPIVGGAVVATLGNRPEEASVSSGAGRTPSSASGSSSAGRSTSDDERSVLLSEMFAHRIGLIDDADLDQVIGKPLRVEIRGQEDGPSFNVFAGRPVESRRQPGRAVGPPPTGLADPGVLDRLSLTGEEIAALRKAIRQESAKVDPVVVADDFRVVGIFRELTDDERKEAWSQFPATRTWSCPGGRRSTWPSATRPVASRGSTRRSSSSTT